MVLRVVRFLFISYVVLLIAGFLIAVSGVVHAQDMSPYKGMPSAPEQSTPLDDEVLSPIQHDRRMGNLGEHGIGHAANHDWYKQLKSPRTGSSCCNGRTETDEGDCRPTRGYWNEGTFMVLVDGKWEKAIFDIILKEPAPDGETHVCASKHGTIYCVIPGKPKG